MKTKAYISAILSVVLLMNLTVPAIAAGYDEPTQEVAAVTTAPVGTARITMPSFDVPARAALLMSLDTGEVLYEKNSEQQMPIASITKVMTLLLTFDAIASGKIALTDNVPISAHSFSMGGSQVWLEPGEIFTLDEMIKAICLPSANDAAVAVAEYVGGSEPVFAEMMNQKAKELGMEQSCFKNACGLDTEGHISTAKDVALMSRELLTKHPTITNYTTIYMDSLRDGQTELLNTNKLLKRYGGITGLKTGTTSGAGVCITASAVREGTGFIAVVLGSGNGAERFEAAITQLDYGFANYEVAAFPKVEAQTEITISGGAKTTVPLEYEVPEKVLLKKGEGEAVEGKVQITEGIAAPVEKGQNLGTVTLALGGEVLGEYPIVAAEQVEKMDFGTALGLMMKALVEM